MKKRSLLILLAGSFLYLTLASDSNGPGGNRSGSHGGTASCGSCHGNSATTGLNLSVVLDSAGTAVTQYVPGITYTVKLTGIHHVTGITNLSKFGFQLSAVLGSGSTSTQAGTWGTLPASSHLASGTSGISVVEHAAKWSPASGSGDTGTTYTVSIPWTAPAAGSGTVTVYGILNAVNNNGNDGTTDKWNTTNAAFTERIASTGVTNIAANAAAVYPNPVLNTMNINGLANNSQVVVYDFAGRVMASTPASGTLTISTEGWAAGMYYVHIAGNGSRSVTTVVKQ
jgi:hypothetical protein